MRQDVDIVHSDCVFLHLAWAAHLGHHHLVPVGKEWVGKQVLMRFLGVPVLWVKELEAFVLVVLAD